jgi:hypothetical protein
MLQRARWQQESLHRYPLEASHHTILRWIMHHTLQANEEKPLKDLAAKVKDAEVHTVDATKPEQVSI